MKPMLVASSTSSLQTSMRSFIGLINETLTAFEPGLIDVFLLIINVNMSTPSKLKVS